MRKKIPKRPAEMPYPEFIPFIETLIREDEEEFDRFHASIGGRVPCFSDLWKYWENQRPEKCAAVRDYLAPLISKLRLSVKEGAPTWPHYLDYLKKNEPQFYSKYIHVAAEVQEGVGEKDHLVMLCGMMIHAFETQLKEQGETNPRWAVAMKIGQAYHLSPKIVVTWLNQIYDLFKA